MFEPKYQITNKLLKLVGAIEASREVIDNAPLVPAWEAKFREDALIRRVHFGTRVEGNDLTKFQAEKIVKQDPQRDESAEEVADRAGVVARVRDVQEVINYRNVMKYLDQVARLNKGSREVLGEKELLQIHALTVEKIVPSNEVGIYRTVYVTVRGPRNGEVVGRPPQPVEVPYQMEDFFRWMESVKSSEIYPVIKAAIIHYELSRIHPFSEGNGRTARAFAWLSLMLDGYIKRQLFSFEEYFDRHVEDYYQAIAAVEQQQGDETPFIEFFAEAMAAEMEKVKEKVRRLSMDIRFKDKLGKQIALTERQIALMEVMELRGELTMNEAREVLPMVSDDTILRDLKVLVDKKLVKKKGTTKGARYILGK